MAGADKTLGDLFELAEAGGLGVKVGVLEGATHTDEKGRSVPVAEYAMANEYGTRRIPPRAAFRFTADARMSEWEDLLATRLWDGVDPRDALVQTGGPQIFRRPSTSGKILPTLRPPSPGSAANGTIRWWIPGICWMPSTSP